MDKPNDYWKKFDEVFFKDGYNLCDTIISNGFNKENLFLALNVLYKNIDTLIDSFLKRTNTESNPAECKKGCSYCCYQTVLASPYELLYLAHFVRKKYAGNSLNVILERIRKKSDVTSNLKLNKLLKFKQVCPFLHSTGGFCMVYSARPMACRIYLSKSVKSCENDLNNPDDDTVYPQLFEMPLRAGRMLNEGFQARVRKGRMNNLQVFENTIETGVLAAFKENAAENWIKGRQVFRKIK
jgi:Fe-S-cluster containining protein